MSGIVATGPPGDRRGARLGAAALLAAATLACAAEAPQQREPSSGAAPPVAPSPLVEVTAASGVEFVHDNGATDRRLLPETMGSGVAVFDADGDGLADLVFADGGELAATGEPRPLAVYRNLGGWRFERVTGTGVPSVDAYAMGLAAGDVDGDGDLDLLVTTVGTGPGTGGDRLFLNRSSEPDGSGRGGSAQPGIAFEDASREWGFERDGGFGSSAAFFDADADGDLDLYAGRYVEWSLAGDVACSPDSEHRTYCTPEVYDGAVSRFYRNTGSRFVDHTEVVGMAIAGKSLGVAVLDVDDDHRLDLAIANDTVPNQLWVNLGLPPAGPGFEERAALAGFAVGASGAPRGGMGIAAGDLDLDGRFDLVVGNFANETAGLFLGEDEVMFRETTAEARLGIPTLLSLTFGTALIDVDGDGWLDVVLANGHIEPEIDRVSGGRQSYRQPLQVFLNRGARFVEAAVEGGWVGRGLAAGDLDGDGDEDLVASQNGGPAVLWRNRRGDPGGPGSDAAKAVRLRLCGPGSNTWGYGARVALETSGEGGGRTLARRLEAAGSYLSSSEPVLSVSLGAGESLERVVVEWPGGGRDELGGSALAGEGTLVVRAADAAAGCPGSAASAGSS